MSYRPLGLEDIMPFGKHKGTKIRVLLYSEIAYITWLLGEIASFELDNAAFEVYKRLSDEA